MSCTHDWEWSDQYIERANQLIGPHLLKPSTLHQDRQEAKDLVVLSANGISIACRIRREDTLSEYHDEFTIRSRRVRHDGSKIKTELHKIIDGWCDWMFYGFALGEDNIWPWHIISLHVFRAELLRKKHLYDRLRTRSNEKPNYPEDNGQQTFFMFWKLDWFDPCLVIARSSDTPTREVDCQF